MKKEYFSPELDVIKIMMDTVMVSPSLYNPDPQDPSRDGTDEPGGDL